MRFIRFIRYAFSNYLVSGIAILLFLLIFAFAGPYMIKYTYSDQELSSRIEAPSFEKGHYMGTDKLGRDVMARMMIALRTTLMISIMAIFIAVFVGVLLGAVAGFYQGFLETIILFIIDVIMSFPNYFLILTVLAAFNTSMAGVVIVIGITSWPGIARLVRSEVLSLKNREFVQAAVTLGASDVRLIFRHILPNAFAVIIVSATLGVGSAILTESSLSFLGLGVQSEDLPTLGNILSEGRNIYQYWWLTVFPGLGIFLSIISFNLIGDGLRQHMARER